MTAPQDTEKRALRRSMKATLRALTAERHRADGAVVARALWPFIEERVRAGPTQPTHAAPVVALFASMPHEISTAPLDEVLRSHRITRALPVLDRGRLAFARVAADASIDALARDRLGIPTPDESAPRVDARSLSCVIIPGLAFDERGGRLGYGKGYYDAVLSDLAFDLERAVAIAHDEQVVARVAVEPHDVRVRYLCTPGRGLFRTRE